MQHVPDLDDAWRDAIAGAIRSYPRAGSAGELELHVRAALATGASLAHAAELSKGCPIFERNGFVEVRPVMKM